MMIHSFCNEISDYVTSAAIPKHIFAVDPGKVSLDGANNIDEDDPDTAIYVRLLGWHSGKLDGTHVFLEKICRQHYSSYEVIIY